MRGLRISLMGRPLIELDGQPLTRLIAAKHQALVFYLAAQDSSVSRARLATLLWGEVGEADARANLRMALSRLRRWLPDILETDSHQVGFRDSRSLSVDLREMEAVTRAAGETATERLAAAADLYRGPLLDGFDLTGVEDFEDWRRQTAGRARRLAVELRQRLVERMEAAGRSEEAIGHARAWLEADESDEAAHLALMRLLAATDQRTAALAQYQSCRAILGEKLGAKPSAQTYALYCRIHADAPATLPRPVPSAGPAASVPMACGEATDLVGRSEDLAAIAGLLFDPSCRHLTLIGPGGVGKTRLALALGQSLREHFPGGVAYTSADHLSDASRGSDALAEDIAQQFGLESTGAHSIARAIAQRLGDAPALVILDNLETVPEVRRLAAQLVGAAPQLKLLATSRARIGGAREWLYEVAGLTLEREPGGGPESSPAARLFTRHARRLDARFDPVAQGRAIERICALVGGLPLALEMAARSVPLSGCAAIAQRIEAGAPLADPLRGDDDRHRSMEIVLQQAWVLLDERAREAALRVAALPPAFGAALAGDVAQVPIEALDALRAQSWLARSEEGLLSLHPLQREFVRRQPHYAEKAIDVDMALARHVFERLEHMEPFADRPAPGTSSIEGLAAAVLRQAAVHAHVHWPVAEYIRLIDAMIPHLNAAEQGKEAAALLDLAVRRADLPAWRRIGWILYRAELLHHACELREAMAGYRRGFEYFGLGELILGEESGWRIAAETVRMLRWKGWPEDPAESVAFGRMMCRAIGLANKLNLFAANRRMMFMTGLLVDVVARLRSPWQLPMQGYAGKIYFAAITGHARLAERLKRRIEPQLRAAPDGCYSAMCLVAVRAVQTALGEWDGLVSQLDAEEPALRALHSTNNWLENRSLAAKVCTYQGRLRCAHERMVEVGEAARTTVGPMCDHWGALGMVETGLRIGCYGVDEMLRLLAQAKRDMSEMENIDPAYTLRWIGLKAMVEWQAGLYEEALETALSGASASRRIVCCGFWAHEGFSGSAEVLLRCRAKEGGPNTDLTALDAAIADVMRAMRAHVRRFPPGNARRCQLLGLQALYEGQNPRAVSLLRESVRWAERFGMRYELARSCELLALADRAPEAGWRTRAQKLYKETGAEADLRRMVSESDNNI